MPASSAEKRLTELIKAQLQKQADVEDLPPDLQAAMADGNRQPNYGELLVHKVVKLAVSPGKIHQFAIELIFDRVEGKSVQSVPVNDTATEATEERLRDITRQHLNDIAGQFVAAERAGVAAAAGPPAGPASRLLALPQDKPARP